MAFSFLLWCMQEFVVNFVCASLVYLYIIAQAEHFTWFLWWVKNILMPKITKQGAVRDTGSGSYRPEIITVTKPKFLLELILKCNKFWYMQISSSHEISEKNSSLTCQIYYESLFLPHVYCRDVFVLGQRNGLYFMTYK